MWSRMKYNNDKPSDSEPFFYEPKQVLACLGTQSSDLSAKPINVQE